MQVKQLKDITNKTNFLKEEDGREINIYNIQDVITCGEFLFYPNILFYSTKDKEVYNVINERVMSLGDLEESGYYIKDQVNPYQIIEDPVFFFVYNTDNYYHFVYDALPYLISFKNLKKDIPDLKLLVSYPNPQKKELYLFVTEFLEILDITKDDLIFISDNHKYKNVYISNSYTHDGLSNDKPRKEIYEFYKELSDKCISNKEFPKKIYISRRTWIHNDFSNIGTNYTTRRKMENEDELVEYLITQGFVEVFTENLSTIDKIYMFKNCDVVVGAIGGGLCNMLFSDAKLISIISPTFLDINSRFRYSFNNVEYFMNTKHVETDKFKKYIRVKYKDIVGEIVDVYEDNVKISYTEDRVAGWNSEMHYDDVIVDKEGCVLLDNGLNSSWIVDMEEFKKINF